MKEHKELHEALDSILSESQFLYVWVRVHVHVQDITMHDASGNCETKFVEQFLPITVSLLSLLRNCLLIHVWPYYSLVLQGKSTAPKFCKTAMPWVPLLTSILL